MQKLFSYKIHFILLVVVASVASSVAILMKLSSGAERSRQALIRSETIQKMNPFKRIVSFKIDELKSELLGFALARKTTKNFGNFNSVAMVQAAGENYSPKWIDIDPRENLWTPEQETVAIKTVPFAKIDGSGMGWFKYQEGLAKPMYVVVFEIETHHKELNKKAYLVGMSPKNPLASMTDDYRGTTGKIYLLNDRAFVAAHSSKNYEGASFSADPVFQDMKSSKRAMSSGSFVDLAGDSIFAYYEKIEHSNLFAVVSTPRVNSKLTSSTQWQAGVPFLLGMGALFAFIAFFFTQRLPGLTGAGASAVPTLVVSQSEENFDTTVPTENTAESDFESLERKKVDAKNLRNDLMKKGLSSINPFAQLPIVSDVPSVSMSIASQSPAVKIESSEKNIEFLKMMSKGLTRIFSERISGVIAEASLILTKTTDDEIKAHAKLIQNESRKSRDLIRELEQYNPNRPAEMASLDLSEVCEHAIAKFQTEIDFEMIELKKDLPPHIKIQGPTDKLQQAIEKVLANSIEALKGRDQKRINVSVSQDHGQAKLTISDTGIGMSKDAQEKIFLPFYREFSNFDGNGLGLSYVQGVLDAMKGEIKVQSSPGNGTEMIFSFIAEETEKIPVAETKNYEALKNPKLDLDFLGDEPASVATNYFELDEKDLDKDIDKQLKELSEKITQQKAKFAETPPEFNVLTDFESDDEDIDHFKVVIREPRSRPTT